MSRKFRVNKCIGSLCFLCLLLIVSLCICSCTSENSIFDNDNTKLLNFSVSIPEWKNNDSSSDLNTRAMPVSGSSFDKASSFNLIADVYDGTKNYSTIIKDEAVSYTNNMWKTTSTHYWPGTANNTVNFYAYYPIDISSSITHTAGSAPTLSYTVPNDVASQIDIMTATGTNVSGNTNSSTPLSFNHIFAAVQFSVGSAGMPNGTITGIALNNILYKGTYSLNGTWTQDPTSKKSFSQTVSVSTNAGTAITSGTTTFMMMPQTLGSDASITVTYSNGGTLAQTIAGTWNAGKIYTYNISKTIPIATFDYTGNVQTYTVPLTGTYKLEVWGAQGGGLNQTETSSCAGYGGYAYGNMNMSKGQTLYICVGGSGTLTTIPDGLSGGGYNGGGNGHRNSAGNAGYGGGGATHIATISGVLSSLASNTSSVIIVAGGGGGADDPAGDDGSGGNGGGNIGGNAKNGGVEVSGTGGTQTSGYSFGQGGPSMNSGADQGGGGGGWYGGYGASVINQMGGGGGSGHIGSILINGTTGMTNGVKTGDGYARIAFVSAN